MTLRAKLGFRRLAEIYPGPGHGPGSNITHYTNKIYTNTEYNPEFNGF